MSHTWPLGRHATYTSPREYRAGMTLQDGSWLPASWHYGCDWAAPTGTPVVAAHPGQLANLNEPGVAGLYVNIVGDGHRTMYMHLNGYARGNGWVEAGEVIGYVGSTGASTGPHLHFQVHVPATGWPSVEPVAWLIISELADVPGQVYQWCREHGLSDAGAAGVMGNFQAESLMDPAIVEGMTHDPANLLPGVREGLGLLQWSFSRRTRLVGYAHGERNRPWQLPEVQLDFMEIELGETRASRDMWARMKTHTDPRKASRDFSDTFVRPGVYGPRDEHAAAYHARIRAGEFGKPTPPARPTQLILSEEDTMSELIQVHKDGDKAAHVAFWVMNGGVPGRVDSDGVSGPVDRTFSETEWAAWLQAWCVAQDRVPDVAYVGAAAKRPVFRPKPPE